MINDLERAEQATRQWLQEVVIGLNLCPFARREFDAGRIHFAVTAETELEALLMAFATELSRIDKTPEIETTLVIFANAVPDFHDYLDLLDMAQAWLEERELEGIFQLASFHPRYQFADSDLDDEANYTNRSPFPVIHILREDSVERAVASHPDPAAIPERNIKLARDKGLVFWKELMAGLVE
ncbi:MAG: DUF1415 domain-containing protein [Gammaproteobacteria bacterium]|nr:DUF1415 domain-containing protein [Gammaproteobacteria bacterium]MDP2141798.1 DUF1415 domain-containing protein [Gammaproteobacteria bacterium]MDP2348020.1 DUF1415 domain-containing protein [Gammaproteobacteria bacterium]